MSTTSERQPVERVEGPNPWNRWNGTAASQESEGLLADIKSGRRWCQNCGRGHCCYFCKQDGCYEPMPEYHTLCVYCGHLIRVPDANDPMNESMFVCVPCADEIAAENALVTDERNEK